MSVASIIERDAKILANDHYEPLSWEQCREIVQKDDMTLFTRSPQQLREYLAAKEDFKKYGGTAEYIVKYKLKWADKLQSSGKGFLEDKSDIMILQNDFPYGLEPGIRHIIVWSKVPCATDDNQRPTAATKHQIEQFIQKNIELLGVTRTNIIWFKNTVALQSVPTLEHFHILIKDAPPSIDSLIGTSGV
ncbi:N-acetylglucosamine-induced protein 1 [Wickerhamiella sorbophila]|uniref:N-acetylglucosamine-induced protein 1 n=1 Tax=Wickerhamiella sorbophila TaxID=45607 RepID=A0A2T0FE91_9ASCO|nr:N-acetylglucosamine-induced protein 1 [Wickerhamiella sorbophila]PRT53269.1 N-acetylglucosamine-induced protein 1 [Wickerhamiella sorbophila]